MNHERGSFTSKIGFLLAAVGAAAGLGNIWKFPYMAGQYGGSAFLLVYLISVVILGIPLLLAEISLGKETRTGIVGAFEAFSKKKRWKGVGYLGVFTSIVVLGFYTMVGGWSIFYMFAAIKGDFTGLTPDQFGQYFGSFISQSFQPIIFQIIFLLLTVFIAVRGVEKGIEKSNKILMPLLTLLLVILMFRSLTLPGATKGLDFLFNFDLSKLTPLMILAALGQAFFSLSLGMGGMLTYGSYLPKEMPIKKTVVQIALYDTIFSLLISLVIFPAIFSFNFEPAAGPPLVFITLPAIFTKIPFGTFFATLFFALVTVAALTSAINILEIALATFVDRKGYSRIKSGAILSILILIFGIPSSLSFGALGQVKLFGLSIFELMDFFASNISLPLGGILLALYVGFVWGMKKAMASVGFTPQDKLAKAWGISLQYIAPIIVFFVLLQVTGVFKALGIY
ncbi:sodium-dependent transporter [Tepidibacillus sp. HK-1]|uniref:sodium-dependent transporter n=1 Tax=Tepidibacillus sp. HK-1 TaxID=1883407 RepID=UPI000852C1BB|nr:sodium-dependent transporter [Tepidibacillus sp. HK-1]GBF10331.1 sodium:neurotransmitter symporter family protein [Tepidibacillus sp. HK-1]